MGIFGRRRKQDPVPAERTEPTAPEPPAELRALVDRLARTCAAIAPGDGPPSSPTSSYAGGYPYLPDDRPWPVWAELPMVFLVQVNLAELPTIDGFPSRGLLQWFVGADDTSGLTFDDTSGTVGFEVRWYDDLTPPALHAPTDPTPWHDARASGLEVYAAIDVTEATRLAVTPARMLPAYAELPDGLDLSVLDQWAVAVGEDADDPAYVWNTHVRGSEGPFDAEPQSNVGGYAEFTQEDPRGHGNFPPAGSPAGQLLIMLDALAFGGLGDSGIAVLFGDPEAVGRGDLSSVRWSWDCF